MDVNTVRLLDLFRSYSPDEEVKTLLDDVKIFDAEIDMKSRSVSVTVRLEQYLPLETIRKIEQGIARAYSIQNMALKPIYDPSLLAQFPGKDLAYYFSEHYAPSMSILAGCSCSLSGDTLTVNLKANGKDRLQPYLSRGENWLREMFGMPVKLSLIHI